NINTSSPALWISDGTDAGSRLVSYPGSDTPDVAHPKNLATFGNRCVFAAETPTPRLIITDSTGIASVVPDPTLSGLNVLTPPFTARGRMYFSASGTILDPDGGEGR